MSTEQQEYVLEGVSVTEVTEEIEKVWGQLQQPNSEFAKLAVEKGVNADELESLRKYSLEEVLVLKKGGGFDPVTVALIVAFAPVAAKITKDVWDNFILGRLQRRFGKNAIAPKEDKH
ncbi:MAG: hypothetical protein AABM67_18675 [Acidobacteriota bacterium]